MGQCPPQSSDDSSIFSSLRKVGDKRFLVVHKRPRPPLVMLDLVAVSHVMRSQIDILEQAGKDDEIVENSILQDDIEDNIADDIEGNRSEISAVYSRVLSSAIPASRQSNATSAVTDTTRVMSNLDRYAAKKKFRQRMATPRLDDIGESTSVKSTNTSSIPDKASDDTGRYDETPGLTKLMLGQCFGRQNLSSYNPPTHEEAISEHLSNVLYLKLRANLVNFYENHYLTLFPNSPRPSGVDIHGNLSSPIFSRIRARDSPTAIDYFDGVQSSPVLLDVDGSSFLDLAVSGSLGLVDRSNGVEDPPTVTPSSRQKSPKHYIVLLNRRSGIPLAVCALKSPNGPPVVRIFATKPRVPGQRQAASTLQLGLNWVANYPLYTWAEFTIEGGYKTPMQYSLYMATGSNGVFEKKPSYLGYHSENASPDIMVSGRTPEKDYKGCAVLSIKTDEAEGPDNDAFFSLAVSRGVDPALFICFAAIVDETIEKNMRLQCEMLKGGTPKQAETYQTPTQKVADQIPINQATKTFF